MPAASAKSGGIGSILREHLYEAIRMRSVALLLIANLLIVNQAFADAPTDAKVPEGATVPGAYTTTWVGNSLANGDAHIPQQIMGICIAPDGTVLTNTTWDEGGGEVSVFGPDGAVRGVAGHTHGWGYGGGNCVAANHRYFFLVQRVDSERGHLIQADTWPPGNDMWFGVSRRLAGDITKPAPFDGGKGAHGAVLSRAFLMVDQASADAVKAFETPGSAAANPGISALAVNEQRLYVADPSHARIAVYDTETMAPLASWNDLPRVTAMAMVVNETMWVAQAADGNDPATVTLFDASGKPTNARITFGPGIVPVALALDSRGHLYVADGGKAANIEIFDPTDVHGTPTVWAKTFGSSMFDGHGAGVGKVVAGKFSDITGIGIDQYDDLYISSGGRTGAVLEKFDSRGDQLWARYGLTFVDNSSIDPLTGDIYSSEEHYHFDWARTAPGSEWSYAGETLDRFRYPQDVRTAHKYQPLMRRLNGGQLYAFASDQYASGIYIYRYDPGATGEVAIPCGAIVKGGIDLAGTPSGQLIWRDANGDGKFDADEFSAPARDAKALGDDCWGWWVEDNGDLWQTVNGDGADRGIRHFPLSGFDSHGAPIYSWDTMQATPAPPPFLHQGNNGIERTVYSRKDDAMFLAGYTADAQHEKVWGNFRVIARYDHWLAGNRTPTWTIALPWDTSGNAKGLGVPIGFAVAGDYLFEVGVTSNCRVHVYRIRDGAYLGDLTPNNGLFTVANTGWVDIRPFGVQAMQRPDGTYAICVEEDWHAKTVIYRWKPGGEN
jgi:hypothetical protein